MVYIVYPHAIMARQLRLASTPLAVFKTYTAAATYRRALKHGLAAYLITCLEVRP